MRDFIKPYQVKNLINKNNVTITESKETGFFDLTVYNNNREPLEDVLVRISVIEIAGLYEESGEGKLLQQYRTNAEGKITKVELPAINTSMTSNNNNKTFYLIAVQHPEYYNAYIISTDIFTDITTSFATYLTHRSEDEERFEFIIQPNL